MFLAIDVQSWFTENTSVSWIHFSQSNLDSARKVWQQLEAPR